MNTYKLIIGVAFTLFLQACSSSDTVGTTTENDFNRAAMLTNMADNLIIPAFESFSSHVNTLEQSVATFKTTPNQDNLDAVRETLHASYIIWQQAAIFEGGNNSRWGPSANLLLRRYVNTYPTKASKIETAITTNTYNFEIDFTIQGLPAMEYLVHGCAPNDMAILALYTSDSHATARHEYLQAISTTLKEKTALLLNTWKSSYRDTFIASTGTGVNSSTSKLLNGYSEYYEQQLRKQKLGGPLGKFTQGTIYANDIESLYAKHSKTYLTVANQAALDFYEGNAFNTSSKGLSLKDYIASKDAQLATDFSVKLQAVDTALKAISGDYHQQISENTTAVNTAYSAMQSVVASIKIELFTVIGNSISYQDTDGD